MKQYGKLFVFIVVSLITINGCAPGNMDVAYTRFTPMVIDRSAAGNVKLEAKVDGSPTSVKLELASTGTEVSLVDDGSGIDTTAHDSIYSVSIAMKNILFDFTPDDVYRNFIGFIRLYYGNQKMLECNMFADIIDSGIPPVNIKSVSASVQYSTHLVNIVRPIFFKDFKVTSLLKDFYTHFGDNYDFVNVIYEFPHLKNAHHVGIKNDVKNIGLTISDDTSRYGSSGRLKGYSAFPCSDFFDGASPHYQHELGHQWINFLTVPPLDIALPHWPLSDLASGIMGLGASRWGQGLSFPFDLAPSGSNYTATAKTDPKVFTDLSLYLMGLIPASGVGNHFVFKDQNQVVTGGMLLGPVSPVGITDIIRGMGARSPNHTKAQKKIRIATIIVSRDGLLSPTAMRFYDYFSARAEGTSIVSYSSGFVKGKAKPFYLSTRRIGELDTRI